MKDQLEQPHDAEPPADLLELLDRLAVSEAARPGLMGAGTPERPAQCAAGPGQWELRFQALVEMLPAQFWTIRADGSIETQSREWCRYSGIADPAANAWSWRDVVHPDDLAGFLAKWQDIQGSGMAGFTEARFKRFDGEYRRFQTRFVPGLADGGAIPLWYASNIDVHGEIDAHANGDAAQLVRGQLDALTHTVEALAMESSPDRLVEHVLHTIIKQLRAHSSSVWIRDKATNRMGFECALEGDQVIGRNHASVIGMNPWIPMQNYWWPFRNGRPEFMADISTMPHFDLRDRLVRMGIVSTLMVPMSIAGTIEGAIAIRFSEKRMLSPEEIELSQSLANHAMLALQLAKLHAQSRKTAVIEERNRMARDIHDTIAQGLTGVIVQLEASVDARGHGIDAEADAHIQHAMALARTSLQEARQSVRALRLASLEQRHWCRALANMLATMSTGTSLQAELAVIGEQRNIPAGWDENLLRIGQETLTNTLRHAQATHFRAQVVFLEEQLVLDIKDDGLGFDTQSRTEGFGLIGIRERVEQMRGALELTSLRGKGTNLRITLPLDGLGTPAAKEDGQ